MKIGPTITRLTLIIMFGLLVTCLRIPVKQNRPIAEINFAEIPSDSVLLYALSPNIPGLKEVYKHRDSGNWNQALKSLSEYFKETAKTRYYFSWEDFPGNLRLISKFTAHIHPAENARRTCDFKV